ncbi:hypothetical protein SS50377_21052 [Spironucleus salmonicida]|uniref:Uncharacterized protein n=1 Tax=Spironucleus salmonicida TaxID=348837 RepID=V6LGP5_9EUKA|nr:hypothetical protein SS50377_21052 [Spironucleus salmonicida]|eukprot:EST43710.1 Hypothetical protein SS50377_16763 [Spironucleus salmonicida]
MKRIITYVRLLEILQRRLINDFSIAESIQPQLVNVIKSISIELQVLQLSSESLVQQLASMNLQSQLRNAIIFIQQKLSTQSILQKNVLVFKLRELLDLLKKGSVGVFDIQQFVFEVKECALGVMGNTWYGIAAIEKLDEQILFAAIQDLSQ